MYEKFDTLVIEPDMNARMRLKQATGSVATFGKVLQAANLSEGDERLRGADRMDVVFVSGQIPQEEVTSFIKRSKENPATQDAAFVLMLKSQNQGSSDIALNVLVGADGLLFEPFSVDSLVEITRLAARVKGERAASREQAAIRFLMSEIIDQISAIAHLKAMKFEASRQIRKLKELCAIFDTLDAEKKALYLEIAVDMFEKAPIPPPPQVKTYSGASSRVKKKLEDKVMNQLKAPGTT